MMTLNKKIMMFEDFAGTAMDSSNNTAPASKTVTGSVAVDKTNIKSDDVAKKAEGEKVRANVIKDVDAILNNLSKLSDQIKESYMLNEDAMASLVAGMKSQFAIAKSTMMLPKYKKLLTAADPTAQKNKATESGAAIKAKSDKITKSLEGKKGISPEVREKAAKDKQKLQDKMAGIEQQVAQIAEKAKNKLAEFETKLADAEAGMAKDSELAKAYQAKKARMKNEVREESLGQALEIAKKQGKKDAAKAKAKELKEIADKQKEIEDKISKAEDLGAEDVAELKGIQAYVKEIDAIMKSREAVKTVIDDAKTTADAISESLSILENEVSDLFSKAKGAGDEGALAKAKELATKMKTAAAAELAAVTALASAISGKEVTKSIVGLAGGDMDAAKEGKGGYTLDTFIPKYGGGSSIVGADEFSSIKAADEVLADVDAAIAKAKEDDTTTDDNTTTDDDTSKDDAEVGKDGGSSDLSDEEREAKNSKEGKIQRYKDLLAKTDDEEKKKKIQDKIDDLSKTEESKFLDPDFIAVLEAELLEFENLINESKELPKKVKLYEGMSIADKFKALM
jgi:hypothetical protein